MPPRPEPTVDELRAYWTREQVRQAREREQAKLRMRRFRERQAASSRNGSRNASRYAEPLRVTTASLHARTNGSADARSTALAVTSVPSEQRETTTDFEQVRCVLAPLRGYAHDERLLQRLAATCPAVDLVLEAIGMAEWLTRTANRKRTCSKAFLSNWVKRAAAAAAVGRTDPQRAAHEPRSALGRVLEQIATSPVDGPSTWGNH